jgi:hypothetical protein
MNAGARLLCTSDGVCVMVSSMSSSCLQGQVRFGEGFLLFILGSSLGGVGPVRGVFGGEEEGGGVT